MPKKVPKTPIKCRGHPRPNPLQLSLHQKNAQRNHTSCYCCIKMRADQVLSPPIDCCVVLRLDAYPNSTSIKDREWVQTPALTSPPAPMATLPFLHPGGASVEGHTCVCTPITPPLKAVRFQLQWPHPHSPYYPCVLVAPLLQAALWYIPQLRLR